MNTETVIGYIKSNPEATKATISENTGAKGIVLHNILQKLISDGLITGTGEGKGITYVAVESPTEETNIVKDDTEQGQAEQQEDNEIPEENENQRPVETGSEKKNRQLTTKASMTRNNDKFKFMGQELGKGPLCRELLRHIANTEQLTYKKLKEMFPDELIPRFGVFQEVERAREISGQKYDRYFFKEEHVIQLKDKKIVVCNQLTLPLIEKVIARAKELGYKVK